VIIFGSQAKGTYNKDSDIDIAVISVNFEKNGIVGKSQIPWQSGKRYPLSIEAIGFSPSQLEKSEQGTLLDEVKKSGVNLKI